MLKKLGLCGALALVLVAAFGTLAPTRSAGQATANGSDAKRLEFRSHAVQEEFVDVGKKGLSVGDYSVLYGEVSQKGEKVGTDGGTCMLVYITYDGKDVKDYTLQCIVTVKLREGQLTHQGLLTLAAKGAPKPYTLAVTGGTGNYKGARGEAKVTPVSQTDADVVVTLID